MLFDPSFQMPVARLTGTVFLRPSHIDRARRDADIRTNGEILLVESALCGTSPQLMSRRRRMIREQLLRHPAQAPQRRLQARAQRQCGLALRPHRPLPVRIRQHRMKQFMLQNPPADRDAHRTHVRPVHRQHLARRMVLSEKHLLARPIRQSPILHSTLERP